MKTSGAPSTADPGVIVGPRHQSGAKQHAKGEKFEKTFADTALRQHRHHAAAINAPEREPDEAMVASRPTRLPDAHRVPLTQAWREQTSETDLWPAIEIAPTPTAGSEAAIPIASALAEQNAAAAAMPIALPWPNGVVASPATPARASDVAAETAVPDVCEPPVQRKPPLPSAIDRGQLDEIETVAVAAEPASPFPMAKVLAQETHMSPAKSFGANQRLDELANTELPTGMEPVAAPSRSGPGEKDPGRDMAGKREPPVAATTGRDLTTEPDATAKPAMSAPAVQVIDALLGASEPAGEARSHPVSSTAQLDAKPLPAPLVRTLKLQLTPESLGVVNVVVARGESSLRIRLEAETVETRGALLADRDSIGRQLEASGLRVDELVVMRPTDSGSMAAPDLRSATASGWASESYSGQRSEHGQSRHSGRSFAQESPGDRTPEEPSTAQVEVPSSSVGDRFLGRRMLRSV